jgi:hypothetical protein
MKRGGPLKRKTPLRAKSPSALQRTTIKAKAPKRTRKKSGPGERYRSPRYLKYVRKHPCVVYGGDADHAHHLIGVGNLSGMGLTAPDWAVMPVSALGHDEIHRSPELQQDVQWMAVAMMLGKAIEDGFFIENPEYTL